MATSLDRFADRTSGWDTPLVVESLLNGARTKAMNPHTPVTTDEVVADALACWDAGACVIHAHNTSFDLTGQAAADDYMPAWSRILKARPDMTWYPTACNPAKCAADEHGLEHCAILARTAKVRIVCIDPGINLFARTLDGNGHILGQEYGWNHRQVAGQVDLALARDMRIIWGIYEPGQLRLALHYVRRGMSTPGSFLNFFLIGDYALTSTQPIGTSGMPPTLESLYFYLDMLEAAGLGHERINWCISIWGAGARDTRAIVKRAIELGGHVKTGLEPFYDPARNPTNLELLQEVQAIGREVGRPLATQDEARRIYGLA